MEFRVGQQYSCPVCGNLKAKIVWIAKEGKVIAVQCSRSHQHKKDAVTLIYLE